MTVIPAWQQALFERRNLGVKLDLEAVRAAHLALGSPGHGIPAIHVLGTNGKGSSAAMCAHALGRSGRRVGLYTSPHLHRVGERVRVDGVAVDDEVVQHLVDRVLACEVPRPLTFFEILTLAAFVHFAELGVDAMVIEAGLGGRLDATRIGRYTARLFTPIDIDHTAYLGPDLAAIAGEKAAVIADGGLIFSAPQRPEAEAVLRAVAARHGALVRFVTPLDHAPLPGAHQRINAALALAGAQAIDPTITAADLEGVQWPGRAERHDLGGGAVIFDVAHNPHGVAALVAHLRGTPGQGRVIGFGCLADKDAPAMLEQLRELGAPLWLIALPGGHPLAELAADARRFAGPDDPALRPAIAGLLRGGGELVVCGSHHLVGHLRAELLGAEVDPRPLQDPLARSPVL
ncbi:MAG: bifunctional folylpolyglutamate synthase/dihydrofolate synthase [Nannocystis sp.]|nr:bifunctional folylpolyglutamate synthase/dihydrofolate synthase [Nannocystis sp.]